VLKNPNTEISSSIISANPQFSNLVELITMNDSDIENTTINRQYDYLLLREKPIFKIGDNGSTSYIVLNWQFLKDKVFKTVIFDFYERSGIKSQIKNRTNFLSERAKYFTEEKLFKALISHVFRGKHNIIDFDDSSRDGAPDCYVRIGKYIFVIEIKDCLMPGINIENRDYDTIKKDILTKFVEKNEKGKAKGVTQILETIYRLDNKTSNNDEFEKKGIKAKNVVVIPILVYTDYNYSMIGVQDILRKEFKARMEKHRITKLGKIEDLIFINLETFYDISQRELESKFITYCIEYNEKIRRKAKLYRREKNMENEFKTLETFEQSLAYIFNTHEPNVRFDSFCRIMQIELPKE
jgi:hypothetical protein